MNQGPAGVYTLVSKYQVRVERGKERTVVKKKLKKKSCETSAKPKCTVLPLCGRLFLIRMGIVCILMITILCLTTHEKPVSNYTDSSQRQINKWLTGLLLDSLKRSGSWKSFLCNSDYTGHAILFDCYCVQRYYRCVYSFSSWYTVFLSRHMQFTLQAQPKHLFFCVQRHLQRDKCTTTMVK